jgi:lysophospholipase L1-like esterase
MKIVLIGDSIRISYQHLVAERCHGHYVWGPVANCKHSQHVLDHFQDWVADQHPDILHFNFGIHDASLLPDGENQTLLPQYLLNMRRFIAKVKELEIERIIWATTTQLYAPQADKPIAEWQISDRTGIEEYNAAALELVKSEGLHINDLNQAIIRNDFAKCMCGNGVHMVPFGHQVLADAVVKAIREVM